jgi:hypothetical protein
MLYKHYVNRKESENHRENAPLRFGACKSSPGFKKKMKILSWIDLTSCLKKACRIVPPLLRVQEATSTVGGRKRKLGTYFPMEMTSPWRTWQEDPIRLPFTNTPFDARPSSHDAWTSQHKTGPLLLLDVGAIVMCLRDTPSQGRVCSTKKGLFVESFCFKKMLQKHAPHRLNHWEQDLVGKSMQTLLHAG